MAKSAQPTCKRLTSFIRKIQRRYIRAHGNTKLPLTSCACHANRASGAESVVHACHARSCGAKGTESFTPATQVEPEVPKVPHLPRKDAAAPNQSQFVAKLPRTSMEVPKVSRLPRKSSLRCRKCHACHEKMQQRQIRPNSSPSFRGHLSKVPKVPRLPHKSSLRRWKCHACHANRASGVESATPAKGTESTTPATQMEPEVLKASRLPRKSGLRCWKCHACHAGSSGAKSDPIRRQASADIYEGTESTTPATQIEPEVLKAARLPRKIQRGQIRPNSSPSFRGHLWRYRKYHACHTNRAWGAESSTPATQDPAAPNPTQFVAKLPRTSMKVPKVPHLPHKSSLRCWK